MVERTSGNCAEIYVEEIVFKVNVLIGNLVGVHFVTDHYPSNDRQYPKIGVNAQYADISDKEPFLGQMFHKLSVATSLMPHSVSQDLVDGGGGKFGQKVVSCYYSYVCGTIFRLFFTLLQDPLDDGYFQITH